MNRPATLLVMALFLAATPVIGQSWPILGADPSVGRDYCFALRPGLPSTLALAATSSTQIVAFGIGAGDEPMRSTNAVISRTPGSVQVDSHPPMPVTFVLSSDAANLMDPPLLFWEQMETASSVRITLNGTTREYSTAGFPETRGRVASCGRGEAFNEAPEQRQSRLVAEAAARDQAQSDERAQQARIENQNRWRQRLSALSEIGRILEGTLAVPVAPAVPAKAPPVCTLSGSRRNPDYAVCTYQCPTGMQQNLAVPTNQACPPRIFQ